MSNAMEQYDESSRELTLRPKRQLTLPKAICRQLGLKVGDILNVTVEGDHLVARPVRNAALDALQEIRQIFQESKVTEEELHQAGRSVRERLSLPPDGS